MRKRLVSVFLSAVLVFDFYAVPPICAADASGSPEELVQERSLGEDAVYMLKGFGYSVLTFLGLGFLAGLASDGSKSQTPANQKQPKKLSVKVPQQNDLPPSKKNDNTQISPLKELPHELNASKENDNTQNSVGRQPRDLAPSEYPLLERTTSTRPIERTRPRGKSAPPYLNSRPPLFYIPLANKVHGEKYGYSHVRWTRTSFNKNFETSDVIDNYCAELIKKDSILGLCKSTTALLQKETTLLNLTGKVMVVGDIHGDLPALTYIIQLFLKMLVKYRYNLSILFLGDYVDRGENSLECISLIMDLKNKFPNNVFMLRGNHETLDVNKYGGFFNECLQKYHNYGTIGEGPLNTIFGMCSDGSFSSTGYNIYNRLNEMFDYLPLAAVVNGKTFCVHGGIPRGGMVTFKKINDMSRPIASAVIDTPEKLAHELLWNDPEYTSDRYEPRSGAVFYSQQDVNTFSQATGCSRILRAHETVPGGCHTLYSLTESNSCEVVTINSVPRKSNQGENRVHKATIAIIDADNNITFEQFPKTKSAKSS